jgi:hypothetical protein
VIRRGIARLLEVQPAAGWTHPKPSVRILTSGQF